MALPNLSNEDRKEYLKRAAEARAARCEIKREIAEGEMSASEAVKQAAPGTTLGRMRTLELLRAVPGIGPARSESIMADLDISQNRRLGGLGKHQRAKLIELLDKRSK